MHHFCTYFDSGYLSRGVALHRSLLRHVESFTLHALCLDDDSFNEVTKADLPKLNPIPLDTFERADPELASVKPNRSLVEYYFTCTPVLPLYVMDRHPDAESISYVDADLYFFCDPAPVFDALASGSILVIPHRYAPHRARQFEPYGRYNVGLVAFGADTNARACLDAWRRLCLDWCYDRLEPNRYADQKFLDEWPHGFGGVVELQHPGANLAPWNLETHTVQKSGHGIHVDAEPLIFHHFHGLKKVGPFLYDPGFDRYGAPWSPAVLQHIYGPYLSELRRIERSFGTRPDRDLRHAHRAGDEGLLRRLLYDRTLLSAGPMRAGIHLEPIARPLLRIRDTVRRAAA